MIKLAKRPNTGRWPRASPILKAVVRSTNRDDVRYWMDGPAGCAHVLLKRIPARASVPDRYLIDEDVLEGVSYVEFEQESAALRKRARRCSARP